MCGVLAVLGRGQVAANEYRHCLELIHHRGPDANGSELISLESSPTEGPRAWLGHTRLSILDLSPQGKQPMSTPDGRYVIVFNGEIYNYLELRNELRAVGAEFFTNTDTEVLLQAWARWGERCLVRLKGMFAFVLVDRVAGRAFVARDFFGIKPLYYCETEESLVLCSEIIPLLRASKIKPMVEPEIAYDYLRFGATNSNDRTLVQGIKSLPPAHLMTFDFASARVESIARFWKLEATERRISFPDAVVECRERFLTNIRLHLRSDVAVGAALSGGIDSSAVVCAMRHLEPSIDLQTFSYIAADIDKSEEKWVDIVHREVGGRCFKIRPQPGDLIGELTGLVRRQGEPFGSGSIYAQYRVFKAAREAGVPVMLDGQGADEMLGGYWPHVGTFAAQCMRKGRLDRMARILLSAPGLKGKLFLISCLIQALLPPSARMLARAVVKREVFPSFLNEAWFRTAGVNWIERADELIGRYRTLKQNLVSHVERGSLPNLLRYEDRNSMAFSVEGRTPFLTHDFAEFLMSLPDNYLISEDGVRKYVFREAMKGILPESIRVRRDKIGFFADDGLWLRSNSTDLEWIWRDLEGQPMFRKEQLRRFVADFLERRHNRADLVWRLTVFGLWLQELRHD